MTSQNSSCNIFDFITHLFNTLDLHNNGFIKSYQIIDIIESNGIKITNPRLTALYQKLKDLGGIKKNIDIKEEDFSGICCKNSHYVKKIFTNDLIIPDFDGFSKNIEKLYIETKPNKSGHNATYIPELAKVDPELFGISICTIDGQQYSIGDTDYGFCVQSCSKPISYLIAVEENGFETVHQCMGCEPSGVEFNKAVLKKINNERSVPHNPMINAGAIMSSSMIQIGTSQANKFNKVMDVWRKLAANTRIGFQNSTFLSEKADADRNMCLGFMMKEKKSFLNHIKTANDLIDVLDFYFQCCSIEYSCEQLSILAATLANGGINPLTNEKIFESDNVKNCLSIMNSCGMYDYSGEWAFKVGIPAKSGVGGGIFLVVPGVMGIATFSPRLDKNGNSVRGIEFASKLTKTYNFHQFDNNLPGISKKINPTHKKDQDQQLSLMNLLFAAYEGDLSEIRRLKTQGFDILMADYDKRTALHLAASEGKYDVVKYLVDYCKKYGMYEYIDFKDRWNRTALDDAKTGNHEKCIKILDSILPPMSE